MLLTFHTELLVLSAWTLKEEATALIKYKHFILISLKFFYSFIADESQQKALLGILSFGFIGLPEQSQPKGAWWLL